MRDRAALYLHLYEIEEAKKAEMSNMIFGEDTIDVNALESFLNANKEQLINQDKPLTIDLSLIKVDKALKEGIAKKYLTVYQHL